MTDFDHSGWARAKAELALTPLPVCGRSVVDRLLSGEIINLEMSERGERETLARLHSAGVIDSYSWGLSFGESKQLRAANERGLIGELFA